MSGSPSTLPIPLYHVTQPCRKDTLFINLDKTAERMADLPSGGELYSLTAPHLMSRSVLLNGAELHLSPDGSLPSITGKAFKKGKIHLAPLSINFLVFTKAHNNLCK